MLDVLKAEPHGKEASVSKSSTVMNNALLVNVLEELLQGNGVDHLKLI